MNASSWSAGRHPRPRPLNQHGTRIVSTKRVSAGHAPSQYTSLPTMIAGRSAAAMSTAARSTSAGSGSTPRGSVPLLSGAVAEPKITSIGKSTNTGPRCGVIAVVTACWISFAVSPGAVTVRADLVIDSTIGTWSSSCNEPEPQRACGARPPNTTSGVPLKCAVVIALTPFVTPGPAVSTARPGLRVSFAQPSAANVAVCSWRTSTMRTSCFTAAS